MSNVDIRNKVILLNEQIQLLDKIFYYIGEEFKWGDKKYDGYNKGISASMQVVEKMKKEIDGKLIKIEVEFLLERKKETINE